MLDLRVWPNREADGNFPSSTPGKEKDNGKAQMQRLAKLAKKHRNGHITKVVPYYKFIPENNFFGVLGWLVRQINI